MQYKNCQTPPYGICYLWLFNIQLVLNGFHVPVSVYEKFSNGVEVVNLDKFPNAAKLENV